jgi:hypothetical protein
MAINDQNGILAGARPLEQIQKNGPATTIGRLVSLLYSAGMPGAGVAPSPGVAGAALTSYAGQVPFTNPQSGETRLVQAGFCANVAGTVLICDRLWHNSGLSATLTTSQTVNSVALPARDKTASINGDGVQIGLEVSTVMGAGTPTVTLGYTNSAAASGRSSVSAALPSAMAAGSFIPLPLAAGDTGVKSIEALTLSASMTSGAFHLVAYKVLGMIPLPVAGVAAMLNAIQLGFPRLADNTVPFLLWLPATATAPVLLGSFGISQG